jgi:hypothetical protein
MRSRQAQAKLLWPIFATPGDEKMENSRPRLFFSRAGEGACSTLRHAVFHGKVCGYN